MDTGSVLREFGLGAQVLVELGLGKVRLLTNRPRKIAGLEGYGLEVVEQILVDAAP
jgi:3,4-dihydroxy 2-butanone 4-phosphate synthase / GTP cyclohydrolase II